MNVGSIRTDDRGASVTVNYVLALGITTVLISGLVVSTGGLVEDRREAATETELRAVGNQLATDLTRAATLGRRGGDTILRTARPELAGGSSYTVELTTCSGPPGGTCLELSAADPSVSITVPVHNTTPITLSAVGDEWLIETAGTAGSIEPPRSTDPTPNIGVGRGVSARPSQRDVIDPRNRAPVPGFVFDPSYPFPNQSVTFVNDTTDLDGNIASFEWDFGDSSANTTGSVTSHSYANPGRYDVTLLVTDDEMAEASLSKQILVTGLVYNNDAQSRDVDGDDHDGGVRFSVTNEFNTSVEISEVYIDPLDSPATIEALSDRDDATGQERSEVYVDADEDAWYDYGQDEDDGEDSTEGEQLKRNGTIADLDLELGEDFDDLASSEQNAELDPGSTATIDLTEFRENVSMAGRNITVGLRYRTAAGNQYASRFVIEPIGGPDAAFTVSDSTPNESESVTFDASPSSDVQGSIASYSWDFGDGTTASGETAIHSYDSAGAYLATLNVTDTDGFTDTTQKLLFVQEDDVVWAVNAGGEEYVSDTSVVYEADEPGDSDFSNAARSTAGVGEAVSNTTDDTIYQTAWYQDGDDPMTFERSIDDGTYDVSLRFAETYFNGPDERVFDVTIEGNPNVTDLDVYDETGGANIAYTETHRVTVTDGELTIEFDGSVNNAWVAAIVVYETDGGGSPKLDPPIEPRDVDAERSQRGDR
jgi:PKD repeat protein